LWLSYVVVGRRTRWQSVLLLAKDQTTQIIEDFLWIPVGNMFDRLLTRAGRYLIQSRLSGGGGVEIQGVGRCLSNER
jgi:hypothetical protein